MEKKAVTILCIKAAQDSGLAETFTAPDGEAKDPLIFKFPLLWMCIEAEVQEVFPSRQILSKGFCGVSIMSCNVLNR